MKTPTTQTTKPIAEQPGPRYHPAFGTMGRDVDLGIAILLAHDAAGGFEILGPVSSINEGIEIARVDFGRRLKALDQGGDPMHPDVYRVWARNYDGDYSVAFEIREQDNIL